MSDNIYYVILIKLIIYGSLLFRVTYVDLAAASHPKWRCCQVIKPAEHPCELGKEFVAALTCPAWALAIESHQVRPHWAIATDLSCAIHLRDEHFCRKRYGSRITGEVQRGPAFVAIHGVGARLCVPVLLAA